MKKLAIDNHERVRRVCIDYKISGVLWVSASVEIIDFKVFDDARGSLVALENKNLPFPIARVFYMYDVSASEARGFHAHKSTKQLLVCTSGQCKVIVDDGIDRTPYVLNSPSQGLYVPEMFWCELHDFSSGSVVMTLASTPYNEESYIRDYDVFLDRAKNIRRK